MLRVLFITGEYPPMQGGVGDYTQSLGSAIAAFGVDVHVLTNVKAGRSPSAPRGVSTVDPQIKTWGWNMHGQVRALVQSIQPHVVHIQYQAAAFDLHPAINLLPRYLHGRCPGPQVAVTFHDLRVPYLFPKAGPLRWWSILEMARRSDLVIVTNAEDRDRLRVYDDLAETLKEIPIGANIEPDLPNDFNRDQQRSLWGVGPQDLLLCYFGFVNASKGVDELIMAVAKLAANGAPVHLLMIGGQVGASDPSNTPYLKQVQALIAEQGVADRVHWTGFVEANQVSAHFGASDIAVLPYRDGVSFRRGSLMAAIAHGLPVVSTEPVVRIPEIIPGENLVVAPVGSPDALAAAIDRLWSDPDQRLRLGAGSALLAQRFTWEAIAQQHVQAYRELIEPSAR
jgi:glycosyltransferase involved in cell wall biosynthesis